ncbi:unnamed protein product [Coregonus sp. 'balchen']|nr:unnamed protein product [Coregonus sp. 'balchen']
MTLLSLLGRIMRYFLLRPETLFLLCISLALWSYFFHTDEVKTIVKSSRDAVKMVKGKVAEIMQNDKFGGLDVLDAEFSKTWEFKSNNVAVYSIQGRRDHMEDRFEVLTDIVNKSHPSIFGIFDGHGGEGRCVSREMQCSPGLEEDSAQHIDSTLGELRISGLGRMGQTYNRLRRGEMEERKESRAEERQTEGRSEVVNISPVTPTAGSVTLSLDAVTARVETKMCGPPLDRHTPELRSSSLSLQSGATEQGTKDSQVTATVASLLPQAAADFAKAHLSEALRQQLLSYDREKEKDEKESSGGRSYPSILEQQILALDRDMLDKLGLRLRP